MIVGDAFVRALGLDLVENRLELANRAHVLPDVQEVLARSSSDALPSTVLWYAFTGMSEKRRVSRWQTFSGSMMIDLGIPFRLLCHGLLLIAYDDS